jgi:hypothetical protein
VLAISLPQPLTPAPPDPEPETVIRNLQHQSEVRLPNLPDLIIEPAISSSRISNSSYTSSITPSQEVRMNEYNFMIKVFDRGLISNEYFDLVL